MGNPIFNVVTLDLSDTHFGNGHYMGRLVFSYNGLRFSEEFVISPLTLFMVKHSVHGEEIEKALIERARIRVNRFFFEQGVEGYSFEINILV